MAKNSAKTVSRKVTSAPAKSSPVKTQSTKAVSKKTPSKKTAPPLVSTGFWLMKSETDSYSIDRFAKDKKTLWTGVRNYLARNYMISSMKVGDQVFFYHSNAEPSAIVGLGKISRINLPDVTALDPQSDYYDPKASSDHPIWFCAEVEYVGHLKSPLSLENLKALPELKDMQLLRKGQRLSILSVTRQEWDLILKKSGGLKG